MRKQRMLVVIGKYLFLFNYIFKVIYSFLMLIQIDVKLAFHVHQELVHKKAALIFNLKVNIFDIIFIW